MRVVFSHCEPSRELQRRSMWAQSSSVTSCSKLFYRQGHKYTDLDRLWLLGQFCNGFQFLVRFKWAQRFCSASCRRLASRPILVLLGSLITSAWSLSLIDPLFSLVNPLLQPGLLQPTHLQLQYLTALHTLLANCQRLKVHVKIGFGRPLSQSGQLRLKLSPELIQSPLSVEFAAIRQHY